MNDKTARHDPDHRRPLTRRDRSSQPVQEANALCTVAEGRTQALEYTEKNLPACLNEIVRLDMLLELAESHLTESVRVAEGLRVRIAGVRDIAGRLSRAMTLREQAARRP